MTKADYPGKYFADAIDEFRRENIAEHIAGGRFFNYSSLSSLNKTQQVAYLKYVFGQRTTLSTLKSIQSGYYLNTLMNSSGPSRKVFSSGYSQLPVTKKDSKGLIAEDYFAFAVLMLLTLAAEQKITPTVEDLFPEKNAKIRRTFPYRDNCLFLAHALDYTKRSLTHSNLPWVIEAKKIIGKKLSPDYMDTLINGVLERIGQSVDDALLPLEPSRDIQIYAALKKKNRRIKLKPLRPIMKRLRERAASHNQL